MTWLKAAIRSADYEAISVGCVIARACEELRIDEETARRYVIKATRAGGKFISDGRVVTLRAA